MTFSARAPRGGRAWGAAVALGAVLAGMGAAPSPAFPRNDVRQFRIGMPVAALPATGYTGFDCAADPSVTLAGWREWRKCPADPAGWRELGFRYDNSDNPLARVNESYRGTRIAGHPVLLSLLIGGDGVVDAIRIDTDPHARMYMRKKAFLLGDQVKARYGEDGWACTQGAPTPAEQPIGGVFVKQHCEKTADGRRLIMDQDLYRDPSKDLQDFVGATKLLIEKSGAS